MPIQPAAARARGIDDSATTTTTPHFGAFFLGRLDLL